MSKLLDLAELPKTRQILYPREVSVAQRQRVVIATALAFSSKPLFAEEPTSELVVSLHVRTSQL